MKLWQSWPTGVPTLANVLNWEVSIFSPIKFILLLPFSWQKQVLQPIGAVEEGVVGYGKEDASACAGAGATTIRSTGYEHQSPPPPYDRKA